MKKGYWVVAYSSVSDDLALKAYAQLAGPAIQANGGKTLVRTSDAMEVKEAGQKQRTVVIEFESFEKAVAAYNSDNYQAALKALGSAWRETFALSKESIDLPVPTSSVAAQSD